jgi:hypothetical protein
MDSIRYRHGGAPTRRSCRPTRTRPLLAVRRDRLYRPLPAISQHPQSASTHAPPQSSSPTGPIPHRKSRILRGKQGRRTRIHRGDGEGRDSTLGRCKEDGRRRARKASRQSHRERKGARKAQEGAERDMRPDRPDRLKSCIVCIIQLVSSTF